MERTQIEIEARYHNFLLKSNKRLMLLYGFGLLLTYPLMLFFCKDLSNIYSLKYIGQTLNVLIAILGSILIPLLMYRYTTAKNSIDVYDSLPLQKESMFRIHFFAGFTTLIIPLMCSFLLGYIYVVLNPQPDVMLASSYLKEPNFTYELIHFAELLVGLLTSYSITIFVKQNCGTIIDSLIYTIVLNLTPVLTYLAFYSYASASLLGFSEPSSTDLFLYLTPFPMMFNYFSNINRLVNVPRFIFFIVLTLVLYIASSHLYVNHASERSESPFMNTHFFPIVSYIITIVAMILLYSSMQSSILATANQFSKFIYPMLIGCIFYLILDVIANRGFAHILKAAIHFLVIALVVVVILIPIDYTKGFGYVKHVPEVENIQSVTIQFPYIFEELMDVSGEVTFTKEEEFEKIVAFHEFILEQYSRYDYSTNYLRHTMEDEELINTYPFETEKMLMNLSLEYNNKIGKIKRGYNIPLSWTKEFTELVVSSSMNEHRIKSLEKTKEDHIIHSMYLSDFNRQDTLSLNSYGIDLPTLQKYLKEDMDSLSAEQFLGCIDADFGRLEIHYSDPSIFRADYDYATHLRIKGCYTKTIEYLTQLGITPFYTPLPKSESTNIYLVYPNSKQDNATFHVLTNGSSNFSYKHDARYEYKELSLDAVNQLLPYAQSNAMYEESAYLLIVNTEDYSQEYLISSTQAALIEEITKDFALEEPIYLYELR